MLIMGTVSTIGFNIEKKARNGQIMVPRLIDMQKPELERRTFKKEHHVSPFPPQAYLSQSYGCFGLQVTDGSLG